MVSTLSVKQRYTKFKRRNFMYKNPLYIFITDISAFMDGYDKIPPAVVGRKNPDLDLLTGHSGRFRRLP